MIANVGLLSYLAAFIAYFALSLLLVFSWRGRPFGGVLLVASLSTSVWAAAIAWGTLLEYPPIKLIQFLEMSRNACWIFFLLQLTSFRADGVEKSLGGFKWTPYFIVALALVLSLLYLGPIVLSQFSIPERINQNLVFITWLAIDTLGLVLLEQVLRNSNGSERWSIKYLGLGLGIIFAYDFTMYAEGLLFSQLDAQLWQARGLVVAVSAPLLTIAIARNSDWKMGLHVSRQVVFHTVTLIGAGFYLIVMAVVGYFIRFMGGTWGGVLQISFFAATGVLLIALLFSGKIRSQTRVFLSKHFFNYKYDYREEWLKFTDLLSGIGENVPDGITRTMASLVSSPAGLLYGRDNSGKFYLLSHWEMPLPSGDSGIQELSEWLQKSGWVIDIDEYEANPDIYSDLELPPWIYDIPLAWLIVPLTFGEKLQGILILNRSELQHSINWEDRDLLKTAGRQVASHLAQFIGSQELVEARQFDAFNRLSAYVVHDLKNILAQQSLLFSNAQKHKNNPEFVEDMITTVGNSVNRMTKLMDQMRSGVRGSVPTAINLQEVLQEVVDSRQNRGPKPTMETSAIDVIVHSDKDRLATVFGHLIQNAQDATGKTGQVAVELSVSNGSATVEIQDDGKGMDADFLKNRLFTAFDSTKGLTGMGIGAFESREFIRSLGGDIRVESTPGQGSLFRVMIPCMENPEPPKF